MIGNTNRKFNWAISAANIISLVTMGSFTGEVRLVEVPADPMRMRLEFMMRDEIPRKDHNPIREVVRILAEEGDCRIEQTSFKQDRMVSIVLLTRRNVPVLLRNRS